MLWGEVLWMELCAGEGFFTTFFVFVLSFFSFYFFFHISLSLVLTLCWCVFFFFCSSQGGAVYVYSGSASFKECSFSGNTARRDVSSLSFLNSLIDLFVTSLSLFLCSSSFLLLHSVQNTI